MLAGKKENSPIKVMKTIAALTLVGAFAAGCTTAEKSTAAGAIIGGGATALAGGNATQIAVGTAVGAAAGYISYEIIGGGDCRYKRRNGTTYIAACP